MMRTDRVAALVAALIVFVTFGGVARAQTTAAPPAGVKMVKMGDSSILTGPSGLTLYTLDTDTDTKSTCNGPCAAVWPPLTADAGAKASGDFTIVTRDDGTMQWAYKGKPLYYYKKDAKPADTTGDGVGGKWHVAKSS